MTDEQRQEIGRLVAEGFTSGRLDDQDEDNETIHIAWELKTDIWTDAMQVNRSVKATA